jgi:hypothetical protein
MADNFMQKPDHKRRTWRIVLFVLLVLLVGRLILPYVLLHLANKRLANMPEHYGHIADLDLSILRGAYTINGFHLDEQDSISRKRTPFLKAQVIDLSVEWRALFDGALVGELVIQRPELRFTKDLAEPASVQKDTADLRALLKDFMPLKVNRVEMHGGVLRYHDPGAKPQVDIQADAIEALVLNLTNAAENQDPLPASIDATGNVYGGNMVLKMGLDPLARQTRFNLDFELINTDLRRLNQLFQAYADFDVNKGSLNLYAELATADNAFRGYVKPVVKDLDVVGPEDRKDGLFRNIWEVLVGGAGGLLTNPRKDQVATKVTFKGSLDDPKAGTWGAITLSLRNAFIQALPATVDDEIDLRSIKGSRPEKKEGFLKKLFGKKDK